MTRILDRPRASTARLLANIAAAVVLAVLLVGLAWIAIDEKASKNVSAASPRSYVQEVPFK